MPQGILIYNPNAGRFPSRILAERAAHVLETYGWQINLVMSLSGKHITRICQQAALQAKDAVFIAGGDGSINSAVRGLTGTKTALGILPAGTSNVWAREIGLDPLSLTRWTALENSARALSNGRVQRVDVGRCNEDVFLMWAGMGLDGFVVHRMEPRGRWEKIFATFHYGAQTFWSASVWHGMNLTAIVDGVELKGHYLVAVVSNVHLYAGGLAEISPDALLDDGKMDLWLFSGRTLTDAIQHAWDLLAGRHLYSNQVKYRAFQSLQMESDSLLYVQVDGEPVIERKKVKIEVLPHSLNVLIPLINPRKLFIFS